MIEQKVQEVIDAYREAAESPLGSYSGVTDDNSLPQQDADDL